MNKPNWTYPLAILALLVTAAPHAKIYKWTDAKGNVHFGDKMQSNTEGKAIDIVAPQPPSSPETPPTQTNTKVVMYGTQWCPYCEKARKYFKNAGIPYVEYDVEKKPSRMREFKQLGGKGYPLILIGEDQKMHGFSESHFEQLYKNQSE